MKYEVKQEHHSHLISSTRIQICSKIAITFTFVKRKKCKIILLQDLITPDKQRREVTKQSDLTQYFSKLDIQVNAHINVPKDVVFYQNSQQKLMFTTINLANYLKDNHQINYDFLNFRQKIEISILYHTSNYQVIQLGVQYGYFSMHINIINVDAKSTSNNLQFVQSGGFGQVCKAWFEGIPIAIKRIRIFENRLQQILQSVIKEYFLLIIASALNCGPKIHKIYGFDLVLFRDYIQFSMELCIKNEKKAHQIQALKEKLLLMHRLQFLHCDIKPANIAYCSSHKTFVFLDFGLSLFAKEKIGEKTITSFMGSIQFCGKEMWDLFMNNTSQTIDLYLNDAISLEKSIHFIKNVVFQQSINVQEESENHSVSKDLFAFFQTQALIMIKSLFYKTMDTANQILNLSKYKDFFHQFKSKIIDFIKLLPLNKENVNFYKKYCHFRQEDCIQNQINKGNFRYTKNSPTELDYSCEIFVTRFHLLSALNSSKLAFYAVEMMKDKNSRNAFFQKPEDNLSAYILTIVHIIKINGETDNFDEKIMACKDILNVFLIDYKQMSDAEIYKRVMSRLFKYCTSDFTAQSHEIFTHVIPTIVILQIVPESDILSSFKMTLGSLVPFVKKIMMIMQFITSLEFIRQKYATSYNYDNLMESFMLQLDDFLDQQFKRCEFAYQQQTCFYRLKQMIEQKIGYLKQIRHKSALHIYLPVVNCLRYLNGSQLLLHDIETYLAYCQAKYQSNRIYQISLQSYSYLSNQIQIRFIHLNHFSYLHFSSFINNYQYKKNYQILQTYGLFQLQLGKFQDIMNFRIYFLQKVNNVKDIMYSQRKDHVYSINERNKDYFVSRLAPIFQILQVIIDSTNEYYYFIDQTYQLLTALEENQNIFKLVREFFNKNIQKLVKFSKKYHKNSDYYHNSNLKIELTTISNIIANYNRLNKGNNKNLFAKFIKQAYEVVNYSECFICKASCLLQIKQIKAFQEINQNPNQQLIIFSDLLAFYLKNSGQISDVERTILNLIRYWRKSFLLVNRYNLNDFIYQFSKQQNSLCICLANIKEYNIFFWLYVFFAQYRTVEQMANFIFDIILQLQDKKARNLITIFYNNIIDLIRMSDKNYFQEIKNYHNLVVKCILQNKMEKQSSYMAIYFSAILQIRFKGEMDHQIMKIIRQGLSKVDNFTKKILLNLYYQQYTFYHPISKKKKRYVTIRHLKHSLQKFKLTSITSKKLIVNQKSNFIKAKTNLLQDIIQKYHTNIQNVNVKKK